MNKSEFLKNNKNNDIGNLKKGDFLYLCHVNVIPFSYKFINYEEFNINVEDEFGIERQYNYDITDKLIDVSYDKAKIKKNKI